MDKSERRNVVIFHMEGKMQKFLKTSKMFSVKVLFHMPVKNWVVEYGRTSVQMNAEPTSKSVSIWGVVSKFQNMVLAIENIEIL